MRKLFVTLALVGLLFSCNKTENAVTPQVETTKKEVKEVVKEVVQKKDTVVIVKDFNEMTERTSYTTKQNFFATNNGSKGVQIVPSFGESGIFLLNVFTHEMGSVCNEQNTLILKFADGTKDYLRPYGKFNCDYAVFYVEPEVLEKLETLEIEKVYFKNGSSLESGTFKVQQARFFIQLTQGIQATDFSK